MRSYIFFVIVVVMVLHTVSCEQQKAEEKIVLPSPEEYRNWSMTIEKMLDYPVPGHLDNCRIIYINTIGETPEVREEGGRMFYDYPEGSMIVKEIYAGLEPPEEGKEPVQLTIMLKASQHPKAQQGWLWVVKDLESGEESILERTFCAECHANANEAHPYGEQNRENEFRDFVYFPPHAPSPQTTPNYGYPSRY